MFPIEPELTGTNRFKSSRQGSHDHIRVCKNQDQTTITLARGRAHRMKQFRYYEHERLLPRHVGRRGITGSMAMNMWSDYNPSCIAGRRT